MIKLFLFIKSNTCLNVISIKIMKKKFLLTFLSLFFSLVNFAQTKPAKVIDATDSVNMMKDFLDILSEPEKISSYVSVDVGIGKRIFNLRNNALNAKVTSVNTIIFSPSFIYHHKSGLYFSLGASLISENKKGFGISQHSISTGYELTENNNVDLAIAYTHYFVRDKFSPYSSPIQNDFYVSFTYKKSWIRPGLAVGYSTGTYGDVKRIARLYDSTTNKLKSFFIIPSLSHEFKWKKIFSKNDGIIFTPVLMINLGQSKTSIQHKTNATNLANFLNKKRRLPKFDVTNFKAESVGLSLDAGYGIGNFIIEPQAYFDYYLPANQDKKLSSYFTITLRYSLQ